MNLETQVNILTVLCTVCVVVCIHFVYIIYSFMVHFHNLSREVVQLQGIVLSHLKKTEEKVNV